MPDSIELVQRLTYALKQTIEAVGEVPKTLAVGESFNLPEVRAWCKYRNIFFLYHPLIHPEAAYFMSDIPPFDVGTPEFDQWMQWKEDLRSSAPRGTT